MPPSSCLAAALLGVLLLGACAPTINYLDPSGPRYSGSHATPAPPEARLGGRPEIRAVTFNIRFARRMDLAVRLLSEDPRLRNPDLLFLQEMDARATEFLARSMKLNYVYYPAVFHPTDRRDLGEAILSPWPIEEDRKIILPHLGRTRRSIRIAVGATVRIRGRPVQAYSVHLATTFELGHRERVDQVHTLLQAVARDTGRVVIAGDLNSADLGRVFRAAGFAWPTAHLGPTFGPFDIDHVFLRGFPSRARAGVVKRNLKASDHRPVWVDVGEAPAGKETSDLPAASLSIEHRSRRIR